MPNPPLPDDAWETLWVNCSLATMAPEAMAESAYGAIGDGVIAAGGGRIAWVGRSADLPQAPENSAAEVIDAGGAWITPGLIDCHTHIVYGGNRAAEFERRLLGASYEEISRDGGGILSTVRDTRQAGEDALVASARRRLDRLTAEGVTTIEIKSGYGLDTETELRMLGAARRLGQEAGIRVRTTFLGAHALPPEFAGRADEYIDLVCADMMPRAAEAGLADAVDAFCETIGFTLEQTGRVFSKARELGLPIKVHAGQLSGLEGAQLAAGMGALSADHLEYLDQAGARAMAASGTVAVLLPGAFYFLRETRVPPVDLLRQLGVPMAVASDCNPGSSPVTSLLLILNMACTLFGMTPEEALAGITVHAARALGLEGEIGCLSPGLAADFVLWDIDTLAELAYGLGHNPVRSVVRAGQVVP